MKLLMSAVVGLTTSLVLAQNYTSSAPFTLKLESKNANVSGQYLGACHAGAAIEQLCLSGKDGNATWYDTYVLNVTTNGYGTGDIPTGPLVWSLPVGNFNVSEALSFFTNLHSNVVVPVFEPSTTNDFVGFDDDDKLFIYSTYYDESAFEPGTYPTEVAPEPLYHWHACYTFDTGYYYQALAWVTAGKPLNPTCIPVNVTREFV